MLIFLLILNGFFNRTKVIEELEIELNWLKLENYEKLIIDTEYIEHHFSELIKIRKKNYLKKSKLKSNLVLSNNDINKIKYENEEILSDSFIPNTNYNTITNNDINNYNLIFDYSDNINEEKYNKKDKKINYNNEHLYAYKTKNSSKNKKQKEKINKEKNLLLKKNKSFNLIKKTDINNFSSINLENKNNLKKESNHNKINYNEYNNIIKNNNNNKINKRYSIKSITSNLSNKGKLGNYSYKVKQNRIDLKKLAKNNEYKDGTFNERLEQIKNKRNNIKSKSKTHINYEEYTNIDNNKDNNNEKNKKDKFVPNNYNIQNKNIICYNFKIDEKEYILEHNIDENIEIEIMKFIQKNNINEKRVKSILEKIKFN